MAWKHRLSNIDTANRTATCSNCGEVSIKPTGTGFWRCRIAINEQARIAKYRRKYKVNANEVPIECELCGGTTRIAYDHCHATGKFRGWLCMKCNTALGLVGDNIELLQKMIDYLKREPN